MNPHEKPTMSLDELREALNKRIGELPKSEPRAFIPGLDTTPAQYFSALRPSGLRRRVKGESPEEKHARKYYKFEADKRRMKYSLRLAGLLTVPTIVFDLFGYTTGSPLGWLLGTVSFAACVILLLVAGSQPVCEGGADGAC